MHGENELRLMHDIWCRYEPMFRQMIYIELWNEGMQTSLVSRMAISWKDIFTNQEYFKQPQWYIHPEP